MQCPRCATLGFYTLTFARKLQSLVHQRSTPLTTVLAQDHFYSDFLGLHVSVKTNNKAMMMLVLLCTGEAPQATLPAGLRTSHCAARKSTEWHGIQGRVAWETVNCSPPPPRHVRETRARERARPQELVCNCQPWRFAVNAPRPSHGVKLTWLVLGGDLAARSHRVEQLTAL